MGSLAVYGSVGLAITSELAPPETLHLGHVANAVEQREMREIRRIDAEALKARTLMPNTGIRHIARQKLRQIGRAAASGRNGEDEAVSQEQIPSTRGSAELNAHR
jgi:hypothetical protein